MFLSIVLMIVIASVAVLAIVNNYYLAFINSYGDINEYYSSKYATISTMERMLNSRNSDGTLLNNGTIQGYGPSKITNDDYTYLKTWTGERDSASGYDLSGLNIEGSIGDFLNKISY